MEPEQEPKKRWLVTRSYFAEQSVELDAESAEIALDTARGLFGTLSIQGAGENCFGDLQNEGDSVYDQLSSDDSEPVLQENV